MKRAERPFPRTLSLPHHACSHHVNAGSRAAFLILFPTSFESWNCKILIRCSAFSMIKFWIAIQRVGSWYHWYILLFCLFYNLSNTCTVPDFSLAMEPIDCSHKNIPLLLSPFIFTHLFLVTSTFRYFNIHLNTFFTYFLTMPCYYSLPNYYWFVHLLSYWTLTHF